MRRIECPLEGHTGEWIERDPKITYGFWKQWKEADHEKSLELVRQIIPNWNVKTADGKSAPKPDSPTAFDLLDVQMVVWLINAIAESVVEDFKLPENLHSPSPTSPISG